MYRGDYLKRGELGQFADLRGGGLDKKDGGSAFEGGLIPQCTLWCVTVLSKLDTLLHKTLIKVILVLRYQGSICADSYH